MKKETKESRYYRCIKPRYDCSTDLCFKDEIMKHTGEDYGMKRITNVKRLKANHFKGHGYFWTNDDIKHHLIPITTKEAYKIAGRKACLSC